MCIQHKSKARKLKERSDFEAVKRVRRLLIEQRRSERSAENGLIKPRAETAIRGIKMENKTL